MNCPRCSTIITLATAKFCEECGAPLSPATAPAAACAHCGAGAEAIDASGFCTHCGLERHRPTARDHWEVIVAPDLGGVCDLGLTRVRNEDFLALAADDAIRVAVVCDGVSQSRAGDEASAAAAPMVCQGLLQAGRTDPALDVAVGRVFGLAHRAVAALAQDNPAAADAPAATIVAACVRGREVVLGWLGDCRAYWFAPHEARLLTKDHSWVNDVVDAGELTYAEALRRKGAHAVTRSLGGPAPHGPDQENGDAPGIARCVFDGPGWLLLCSDGLWGYAAEPAELAIWLAEASRDTTDASAVARALVQRARQSGGRDNITVALVRL